MPVAERPLPRVLLQGALVAAADVDSAALAALADELPGVLTMTADVSSEEQVKDMAATIQQEFGGLDGMVKCERPHSPRLSARLTDLYP